MRFLVFFFIFFSSKVFAVYAFKNSNGEIILKGANCQELLNEAQQIFNWAFKLKDVFQDTPLTCNYTHFLGIKWGFEINISKITPILVKKYLNYRPTNDGPNCWNSTLVMNKISPFLRYTSPEEFSFWLKSPLCREKNSKEEMVAGDVIAIREYTGNFVDEYHGLTYISPHLSFTKNGLTHFNSYSLVPTDDVFKSYGVKEGCRLPPHQKGCQKAASVFSCQSFEQYISGPLSKDLTEALEEIDKTECAIEQLSMFGDKKNNKSLYNYVDMNVDILEWIISDLENKKGLNEKEIFLIRALRFKINAIKSQMRLLK